MIYFTLEPDFATLIEFSAEQVDPVFRHAIPRAEFLSGYNRIDFTGIRQLSYEPDKGYYHIIGTDGVFHKYETAEDNSIFSSLAQNISEIKNYFETVKAAEEAEIQAQVEGSPPITAEII